MRLSTINEWLSYISAIHIHEIELGIDRIKRAAAVLGLLEVQCPVIIVGGTNGKGSTVAGLDAIYRVAGYKVGTFTSPYLLRFNEQVKISGVEATDPSWCEAFEYIETGRQKIPLTPFEFHTLAALYLFKKQPLDLMVLEVGLGGRLDAVNILDADVAIVTSIALDHMEWLGPTRESIAIEKAGIFRPNQTAVCGDEYPPTSLLEYAKNLGTKLYCQKRDFSYQETHTDWSWQSGAVCYQQLPKNSLLRQNMSTLLMAVELLQKKLPVSRAQIDQGLVNIQLAARREVVPGRPMRIFDVAHNPAAAKMLAQLLSELAPACSTHAVFSMLGDKDISETIKVMQEHIDHWHVAALPVQRGASLEKLKEAFAAANLSKVTFYPELKAAYQAACVAERVIIFGSFHTVSGVYNQKSQMREA